MLVGCQGDNDDPKEPTKNNKPFTFMKEGNEWVYDYNDGHYLYSETIVSKNNDSFCVVRNIICPDNFQEKTYYWYIKDNYWCENYYPQPSLFGLDYIIIPQNCYIGQKWRNPIHESAAYCYEIVSLSETETETVPAGTFDNCIKLKCTIEQNGVTSNFLGYSYYRKDIGRISCNDQNGLIVKLHSYNLKK